MSSLLEKLEQKSFKYRTCPHCEGTGQIEVVEYPASGAEIQTHICGVCGGKGRITFAKIDDVEALVALAAEDIKKIFAKWRTKFDDKITEDNAVFMWLQSEVLHVLEGERKP